MNQTRHQQAAEPDAFWVPAMSCQLAAKGVFAKMTKAVEAGAGPTRAEIIGSALRQARELVDGLTYLEAEVKRDA